MGDEFDFKEVTGEQSINVRWSEEPQNVWQKEHSTYFGNEITGLYERKRENVGENKATIFEVRHKEHGLLSIWGSTVLLDKMNAIPVNSMVKIQMTGQQKPKNGGKAYFLFKVFYAPAPMIEAIDPDKELKDLADAM